MARPRTQPRIENGLYIIYDQAYTPKEWQQRERRREQYRRAREVARSSKWFSAIGSLHSLSCRKGHHRQKIGNCTPIPVYRAGEAA